jgi:hypothetical protein
VDRNVVDLVLSKTLELPDYNGGRTLKPSHVVIVYCRRT